MNIFQQIDIIINEIIAYKIIWLNLSEAANSSGATYSISYSSSGGKSESSEVYSIKHRGTVFVQPFIPSCYAHVQY